MDTHVVKIEVPAPSDDEIVIVAVRRRGNGFVTARTSIQCRAFDVYSAEEFGPLVMADLQQLIRHPQEPPR